jgi:hypothetical protein
MAAVELEAVLALEHPEEGPELGPRDLLDVFAVLAEQCW